MTKDRGASSLSHSFNTFLFFLSSPLPPTSHCAPNISMKGMFLCTVTIQFSVFLCRLIGGDTRVVAKESIHGPEGSSLTLTDASAATTLGPLHRTLQVFQVFDCNFLSFCQKGFFPKPSLLQKQHPYPCGPQPSFSYLINSFWQKGKIPLEHLGACALFWPKFEVVLWSQQSFLIYCC